MPQQIDFAGLARILAERGATHRHFTAIVGPPASGKSTLAKQLLDTLNRTDPGSAALVPMDGFHFDDRVLEQLGRRAFKGAPDTFDAAGLAHLLERLAGNAEANVAIPLFDRSIEISRAGAALIPKTVRHLLVEGNYLLLDDPIWAPLRCHFGTTVMVTAPEPVLRDRLLARWADLDPAAAAQKTAQNDLPNARLVATSSVPAEFDFASPD